MKYGFILPGGNAGAAANLAYEAEQTGWDGFFVLDPVWGIDVWVSLAAAAMRTERILLGPVLTPVLVPGPGNWQARQPPWTISPMDALSFRLD